MADLDGRDFRRARQQVVGQGRGERLAVLVERNLLVQGVADALRDAADDLPVDDERIHHRAAVLDHGVVEDFDLAGVRIDRHHRGLRRIGEDAGVDGRLVGDGDFQQRLDARRQRFLAQVRDAADVAEGERALGTVYCAVDELNFFRFAAQGMRSDPDDFLF